MDSRVVKTKTGIRRTVIELLNEKHLSEITVSELCKKAQINRNTFYAHYRTPVEVIEEITNDFMSDFERIAINGEQIKENCVAICRYIYEKKDVFSVLININAEQKYSETALLRARQRVQANLSCGETDEFSRKMHNEFIIGGCYFVLRTWIASGAKETPDKIGETIYSFFKKYNFTLKESF